MNYNFNNYHYNQGNYFYQNNLNNGNNGSDDYYEMVSDDDDESFGEGGNKKIQQHMLGNNHNQFQTNQSSAIDLNFDQLPFVPKFSSEIRNTVEAAKVSDDKDRLKTPLVGDWGPNSSKSNAFVSASKITPDSQSISCPYFPDHSETPIKTVSQSAESVDNSILKENEIINPQETASKSQDALAYPIVQSNASSQICSVSPNEAPKSTQNDQSMVESNIPQPLTNFLSASASTSVVQSENVETDTVNVKCDAGPSWADENGDPIMGAFDDIKESVAATDNCINIVNNTKVEYVFHVKEKKGDVAGSASSISNSDVGSANISYGGIPKGVVISSLVNTEPSNSLDSSLVIPKTLNFVDIQDDTGFSDKISDEYDQKTLYEASKNKQELSNIHLQDENTASTSASAFQVGTNSKETVPKSKTEMLAFRRNNFINQKKEMPGEMGIVGNEEAIPTADKALESQALNELLREVKQGAERARNYGALGWQKQPIPVVNKRFLKNTLVSTLRQPYKPPTRGGRFHKGLHDDRRKKDDDNSSDSSSSRSRSSRSSSRSRSYSHSSSSSSSSRSSSGSRSRSRSRRRHRHSKKGKHPHPWPGGGLHPPPPNAYYDWAAYGYPWYDPAAAAAMYYGMGDGGAYPQMYSNDPQFWAAYRDFYGISGGGGRGRGGFRGGRGYDPRGGARGGRGKGRGGGNGMMDSNERWSERVRYSDEEYSSLSRSRSRSRSKSGSGRKRSNQSHSPDSNSSKRKKRNESSEKQGSCHDEIDVKHTPGISKSADGLPDADNPEGKSKTSKSKSSKKKKSGTKKADGDSKGNEGGDKDDKEGKKKKRRKSKKHKKSKTDENDDNCGEEKEKLSKSSVDDELEKVKEIDQLKASGDQTIEKASTKEIEKESSKVERDDSKGKETKKKKKVDSKKKDGKAKKKLKKSKVGDAEVKGVKSQSKMKNEEKNALKGSSAEKTNEDTSNAEIYTKVSGDKLKCGEPLHQGEQDEHHDEEEKYTREIVESDTSRKRDDNEKKSNNDRLNKYDDEVSHSKMTKKQIREDIQRDGSRKRDCSEKNNDCGRSNERRHRYDDEVLDGKNESSRRYDVDTKDRDRHRDERTGNSDRSRNYYADSEGDRRRGVKDSERSTGHYTDSERGRKRGGKLEEIERRLQERKANRAGKADHRVRHEKEDFQRFGRDAKQVGEVVDEQRFERDGDKSRRSVSRDRVIGNEKDSIPSKEKISYVQSAKDGVDEKEKSKKVANKKVKKKLEKEGGEIGSEGSVSVSASSSKDVKKKGGKMKRKSGAEGDPGKAKKMKKKKKKLEENETSNKSLSVSDLSQGPIADSVAKDTSHTEDVCDRPAQNDALELEKS